MQKLTAVLVACGTDGRGFEPRTSTNACGHVCKYMYRKGSAAMPLYSQQVAHQRWIWGSHKQESMQGIHPGFKTQDRRHQKAKTGVSVAPLVSSKIFLKKNN